jgi:mannan endo-1,4-beta-mannosidase
MKTVHLIIVCLFVSLFVSCEKSPVSDPKATPEAKQLFARLQKLQEKGIMYGHQDDLMTGTNHWYEPGSSDTKDAVGDYPAVAGFELGEIETGHDRSLDSVSFAQITEQVKIFHKKNGIITISWHAINPITSQYPGTKEPNGFGSAWDVQSLSADGLNAVKTILPGGENHAMFNQWLTTLADYFLTWKDDNGKLIPFLFRPYHEHSGSFFWWGETRCTDEEYAALWRYTVDFLRNKGLHNILFAYNTDKVYSAEQYLKGYPGDEYIDMLSLDWYGQGPEFNEAVDKALTFTTQLAQEKHKLYALSECGPLSVDLQKILEKYKTSYVLTWRNAPSRRPVPTLEELEKIPGFDRAAYDEFMKQPKPEDLLKAMRENTHYLFLQDIQDIK